MKIHDACDERESLAKDLARWQAAGFWNPDQARLWRHRVRRLARSLSLPTQTVLADLKRDAACLAD
jgi:hypothetical protein